MSFSKVIVSQEHFRGECPVECSACRKAFTENGNIRLRSNDLFNGRGVALTWEMRRSCCFASTVSCIAFLVAVIALRSERREHSPKLRLVRNHNPSQSRYDVENNPVNVPSQWFGKIRDKFHSRTTVLSRKRRQTTGEETLSLETCVEELCVEGTCSEDKTKCVCSDGFSGKYCQYDVNECRSDPCHNEARCIDGVNRFYCDCEEGWTGDDCSEDIDECSSMPCYGRGECLTPRIAMFFCRCRAGFYGINCENDIEECWSHPCQNGGSCVDMVDRYFCKCPSGFNGTVCEEEIDECVSSPCQNGGICLDKVNRFQCQCLDGHLGAQCEEKVDECRDITCKNGGECVDSINRAYCSCTDGFEGEFCEQETDECLSAPCRNSGTCLDMDGDYQCICNDGFDGRNCEININECNSQPCQNNGRCIDDINGYFCECPTGFIGERCDVNVDECTSEPCRNGAECRDNEGGFLCLCSQGYTGITCDIPVNPCRSFPCQNAGTCREEAERFQCDCHDGFAGERCEIETNECASTPCINGGRCVDLVSSYICECSAGYKGDRCELEEDECDSNPCRNAGTCIDGHHSFRCICDESYEGVLCERKMKYCQPATCLNGGKCHEKENNGFFCQCLNGFEGDLCQVNINNCGEYSCENGGLCIDEVDSFSCICREGYQGKNCNDSTVADAENLSQTMLSTIPTAGIFVLCVVAISLTLYCLRRRHASAGDIHMINNTDSVSKKETNGKVGSFPPQGMNDGESRKHKKRETTKQSPGLETVHDRLTKGHRSRPTNEAKQGENKRKKKVVILDNGKSTTGKKDNETRKKRRKMDDSKSPNTTEERESKERSKVRKKKRKGEQLTDPSQRRPTGHEVVDISNQAGMEAAVGKVARGNHEKEFLEESPVGDVAATARAPAEMWTDRSTKPVILIQQPELNSPSAFLSRNNQSLLSQLPDQFKGAVKIPEGPILTVAAGDFDEKGTRDQARKNCEKSQQKHGHAEEGTPRSTNIDQKTKRDHSDCQDASADGDLAPSSESAPIYLPLKTANGMPLYLRLGRLDQCTSHPKPAVSNSTPTRKQDAASDNSQDSRMFESHAVSSKSPVQMTLSSPWQPVWKYNFPHLLMEDTQLVRQLSHGAEQSTSARNESFLRSPSFAESYTVAADYNKEKSTGNAKGNSKLENTFLKEEIRMLVKTRENWQSFEGQRKKENGNFTHPPRHVLNYSRHFTPPHHHESQEDENEEFAPNPEQIGPACVNQRLPADFECPQDSDLSERKPEDLWERAECKRLTGKKPFDEAWEDTTQSSVRATAAPPKSNGFVNEFGMINPHGMSRENAFVNNGLI